MPVTVKWSDPKKTISVIRFIRPWTWNEYYITHKTAYAMTDSVDHIVNVVVDFTESDGRLPPGSLYHFRKAAANAHPRRGVVVIVSPRTSIVKMMIHLIKKAGIVTSLHFTNTISGAFELIEQLTDEQSITR